MRPASFSRAGHVAGAGAVRDLDRDLARRGAAGRVAVAPGGARDDDQRDETERAGDQEDDQRAFHGLGHLAVICSAFRRSRPGVHPAPKNNRSRHLIDDFSTPGARHVRRQQHLLRLDGAEALVDQSSTGTADRAAQTLGERLRALGRAPPLPVGVERQARARPARRRARGRAPRSRRDRAGRRGAGSSPAAGRSAPARRSSPPRCGERRDRWR